jgi:hypothetical protein
MRGSTQIDTESTDIVSQARVPRKTRLPELDLESVGQVAGTPTLLVGTPAMRKVLRSSETQRHF